MNQGGYNNNEPRKSQENVDANEMNNEAQKRYPFDQKPFSYQKDSEWDDEENKGYDKPHYVYVNRPQSKSNNPQKDPDVWDNPPPRDNCKSSLNE